MPEYIEREAVLEIINSLNIASSLYAGRKIINLPAADVAPVRHGRWIERKSFHADGGIVATCSACHKDVQYLGNPLKYCPNCGAKMDLED